MSLGDIDFNKVISYVKKIFLVFTESADFPISFFFLKMLNPARNKEFLVIRLQNENTL